MKHARALSSLFCSLLVAAACDSGAEAQVKADAAALAGANADVAAAAEAEGKATVKADADKGDEDEGDGVAADIADRAQAIAEGSAAVEVQIKAEDLDLDAVVTLVKKNKIKDARQLEKTINDRKKKLVKIDIDDDKTLDFVQVVEVKEGAEVHFELRVVPSSKKDAEYAITVATIAIVPDKAESKVTVRATYTAVVEHHDVYVYEYAVPCTFDGDVVVVAGAPFFGWVFAVERPVYVGVYVHDEWIAVPGVVFVVDVDVHGGCWPPGHCKHGKFKHGKFKHGKHGKRGKHGW